MQKDNTSIPQSAKELREQEAPEKNTDKAFVKVSDDGSPDLGDSEADATQADALEPKK